MLNHFVSARNTDQLMQCSVAFGSVYAQEGLGNFKDSPKKDSILARNMHLILVYACFS